MEGLVGVGEEKDFGGFPSVVPWITTTEPVAQFRVEGNVGAVFPVIGADPIVADSIAEIVSSREVTRAGGAVRSAVFGGEDLEVKSAGIPVPSQIL